MLEVAAEKLQKLYSERETKLQLKLEANPHCFVPRVTTLRGQGHWAMIWSSGKPQILVNLFPWFLRISPLLYCPFILKARKKYFRVFYTTATEDLITHVVQPTHFKDKKTEAWKEICQRNQTACQIPPTIPSVLAEALLVSPIQRNPLRSSL